MTPNDKTGEEESMALLPDDVLGDVYVGAGNWRFAEADMPPSSRGLGSAVWRDAVSEWDPELSIAPVSSTNPSLAGFVRGDRAPESRPRPRVAPLTNEPDKRA